jgi:hypothetical protein
MTSKKTLSRNLYTAFAVIALTGRRLRYARERFRGQGTAHELDLSSCGMNWRPPAAPFGNFRAAQHVARCLTRVYLHANGSYRERRSGSGKGL